MLVAIHLVTAAAVAAVFAWQFGHAPSTVASHLLLVAEWDLLLVAVARARVPRLVSATLVGLTLTAQAFLYALDAIGNASWGRNVTLKLVTAFAPTVWSGKEPFPVGRAGITLWLGGTFIVSAMCAMRWMRRPDAVRSRVRALALAGVAAAAFGTTIAWGVADRDRLIWKDEPLASFFRPVGYAFEPTARREAVADRDAIVRAAYPRSVPTARRANVVLIIVDSLRADRMQVYGYPRETTPFLARLVASGRMQKVEAAFSTCSESFCGITSTLASREFRDISARTYQLQDVLRDEGYRTWFLLSGNHSAWNGLPQFYHSSGASFFDGSMTTRYTMDDDRVVLEGLERVPPASPAEPAFFYLHLMSTHYLGVQLPESHVFTRADDAVDAGVDPYANLPELDKPDRYDDKVRQADGIIARIFDVLRAKGYLDRAAVVVTSDHGEGLGERHWAHGWHLYNEDMRIPLLLFDTPSAIYPDLTFATQVDIAPTIVDRLGLPIPTSWEGESLLAPSRTRFTYHQTYFLPNRFAVIYRNDRALYKFIATPDYGKEELYDLAHDRGESRNLVGERPALAALLREKIREYRAP
ncbi:MAG TPA: sulfatase-like hydrolase/transferase [Vicinamibacterales bacterium]|nr:sulfatase-like hydrolase/transferase [Vicinamibacterales bacterium]